MRGVVVVVAAAVLAACGSRASSDDTADPAVQVAADPGSPPAVAAGPDLAACPARDPVDEGLRQRSKPIPVPAALREAMRSGMDNLAFSTLEGATVCVEAGWMESIRDPALSADRRFASFGWDGYESYGHVIVNRMGRGQIIDTGVPPVASPSGKLLAAADLSESGFGALNAFAVWRIEAVDVRQLAKREPPPEATDWRVEGWAGESCVDLSAVPWEALPDTAGGTRDRFHAQDSTGWRLEPGRCASA